MMTIINVDLKLAEMLQFSCQVGSDSVFCDINVTHFILTILTRFCL